MSKFKNLLKKLLIVTTFITAISLINPISVYAAPGDEEGEDTEGEEGTETQTTFNVSDYVVNLPVDNNVYLSVFTEYEWYNSHYAICHVLVTDVANSGWEAQSISAKIGKDGNWIDITDDKTIVLSENGSLYLSIKDTEGKTYDKTVNITCFDYTSPELNAAVSDGVLLVQPVDDLSGIDSVFINGYQFTYDTFIRGSLSVRLQQFDATFPYFLVQAVDKAGNLSSVYKFENPYYVAGEVDDQDNPAAQLPISALPTAPGSATGEVTDHVETDWDGESIPIVHTSDIGRSFYTIQTESGKIFYLIVSRDGNREEVHFVTDVSEQDLLNTLDSNSDVLPMNSAATTNAKSTGTVKTSSATPTVDNGNTNNGNNQATKLEVTPDDLVDEDAVEAAEVSANNINKSSQKSGNLLIIVGCVIFFIIAYIVKFKKPKQKKMTDEAIMDEMDDDEEIEMEEE